MSKIGDLAAGVGVETVLNLQFLPEFIIVGDLIGGNVSAISWNVAGKELVNLLGLAPVQAYAEFKQNVLTTAADIANILTTGEGYMANQQFQLRITNNTAGALDIFGFSRRRGNGNVLTASQVVVLDGANQRFNNFLALGFLPTNVTRVDLTFKNARSGATFTDSFTVEELAALLALDNPSVDGTYATLLVLDNTNLVNKIGSYIESATIYVSGANLDVTVQGMAKL